MSYTFEQYQCDAARTINWELSPGEMLLHAVFGMSSEVGEVAGNFQKRYQGHELDNGHVLKEAGDALWFIAELCTACGVTMEEVAEQNIAKLQVRYPEKFDADRSVNRERYGVTDEQMEAQKCKCYTSDERCTGTKEIDAVPVKHGHWTNAGVNNDYFWLMQCSVCHGLASQVAEHFVYEFCPHCGAKMDEVTECD